MGAELIFTHDHVGDILMIDKRRPYRGQGEDEIDELVVCRFDATTGEIENTEIIFFKARMERDGEVTLPMDAALRFAPSVTSSAGAVDSEYVPGRPDARLNISYSAQSDTLKVSKCPPYDGQATEALDDLAAVKLNPETGEIEHLEIRRFYRRLENKGEIRLPIHAWLRSTEETFPAPLPIPAKT